MKKKFSIFVFTFLLFKSVISITVYQCSNMQFLSEQCMLNYTDKNGDTHILLKMCQENKICQPSRDYSMGFCIFNVKELSPMNKCYYPAQCSTRICGEVCHGYVENKYCNPEKMECANNMNCRKTLEDNKRYVYKCLNVSEIYEECDNNNDCGFNLVCGYNKSLNEIISSESNANNINLTDIINYMNSTDYLNLTENKYCINRASLENGIITNEEMACESGQLIPIMSEQEIKGYICGTKKRIIKNCDKDYKCLIEVDIGLEQNIELEQECLFSNVGNLICPLDQKEKAWKNYLDVHNKKYEKENLEKKIHVPYDKYSLQSGDVLRAYWEYFDWIHSIEGDECSKQYFFINNKSNMIVYNNIIEILLLYILFI